MKTAIESRPSDVTAIDALRTWVDESMPVKHEESPDAQLRKRMCIDEPALSAHQQHLLSRLEEILRVGVARDLGDPPDGLRPRLVAAAAVAALSSIDDEQGDKPERMALLDETLIFLRGGVAALQNR